MIGYRRSSNELLADAARAMGRMDLAANDATPGEVCTAVLDYFRGLDSGDGRERALEVVLAELQQLRASLRTTRDNLTIHGRLSPISQNRLTGVEVALARHEEALRIHQQTCVPEVVLTRQFAAFEIDLATTVRAPPGNQ